MPAQTLSEKLLLKDEKHLLIQGLPSSLEKQFIKFLFAKNLTPLLKNRKIEFALVFAINRQQLKDLLNDILPFLQPAAKLWIGYPKLTSKIASDLNRDANWDFISKAGYEGVRSVALDNVWSAIWFKKPDQHKKTMNFCSTNPAPGINNKKRTVKLPAELQFLFTKNEDAAAFFESLAFTHKREYVEWIISAKREDTKAKRLETTIEKLIAGKKNYNEK